MYLLTYSSLRTKLVKTINENSILFLFKMVIYLPNFWNFQSIRPKRASHQRSLSSIQGPCFQTPHPALYPSFRYRHLCQVCSLTFHMSTKNPNKKPLVWKWGFKNISSLILLIKCLALYLSFWYLLCLQLEEKCLNK